MKKLYSLALAALVGVTASAQDVTSRAAMATGISHEVTDGTTTVTFNVTSNTAQEANLVLLKNNKQVAKVSLGPVAMGVNTKSVQFVDLDIQDGKYNYAIEVTSKISSTEPVSVYSAPVVANQRMGITAITDPESDLYGTVVAVKCVNKSTSKGIDIITPDGNITNYLAGNDVMNGMTSFVSAYERYGKVLISSWSDAGSGIYCFDPANPDVAPFQLFGGSRNSAGLFTYAGVGIGGSENGMGVSLDGTKIYAFSEELDNGAGTTYSVGTGDLTEGCIKEAPDYSTTMISVESNLPAAGSDASPLVRDGAYCTAATPYGIMVGQARAGADQWPFYIFWDPTTDKTLTYRDGNIFTSSASGCAFNKDLTLFAHMRYTGVVDIHDVTWETSNGMTYPVISEPKYSFAAYTSYGQIVFDAANNVYVSNNYYNANTPYAYAVYALPGEQIATTPAKAADLMDVAVISSAERFQGRAAMATGVSQKTEDGVTVINYTLTGNTATSVNLLLLKNEEIVKTIPLNKLDFGANSVEVDLSSVEGGKYNYAIEVNSTIAGDLPIKLFRAPVVANERHGVAYINDPESENYGDVVVIRNQGGGIDIISPTCEVKNYLKGNDVMKSLTSHVSAYERKGKVLISSWSDAGSGIYCFDPADPTQQPFQLFKGARNSAGLFTYAGEGIGGSENGIGVSYDGTQIYAFSEELENGQGSIYEVGDGELTEGCITTPPTFVSTLTSDADGPDVYPGVLRVFNMENPLVQDGAYCTATTPYGVMIGQGRSINDKYPLYIFWDPETGNTVSYQNYDIFSSSASACAFNKDYTLFAHVCYGTGENTGVKIHNVTWVNWEENNQTRSAKQFPTFSEPIYPYGSMPSETNYAQAVFDDADNLYVTDNYYSENTPYAYTAYALPGDHTSKTPAKANDLIEVLTLTGISDINAAAAEVAPVYYNLQGVRVDNPRGGHFIEVRGTKAVKVLK